MTKWKVLIRHCLGVTGKTCQDGWSLVFNPGSSKYEASALDAEILPLVESSKCFSNFMPVAIIANLYDKVKVNLPCT